MHDCLGVDDKVARHFNEPRVEGFRVEQDKIRSDMRDRNRLGVDDKVARHFNEPRIYGDSDK